MADIGTERLLLAALRPLAREGGLLAALPADKGAFEAHLRHAGARTDAIDTRPSPIPQYAASRQYAPGDTMAQRQVDRSGRPSGAPREDKPSYEAAPAAVPTQSQSTQTTEAQQQDRQTGAAQDSQPQQTADPTTAPEKDRSSDDMQSSSAREPCTEGQQEQAVSHQLGAPDQSFHAREITAAAARSTPIETAAAKHLQPQPLSGDAGIVAASDQTVIEGHSPGELPTAEPSATQPAADENAGAAHEGSATLLRQAGVMAAASVLEPIETAALSADKLRAARESQRGKDSASGEARAAGSSNNTPTEQTSLAASGQPAPAQVVQSAGSGDGAAAQHAGEAASGKSDAALRIARQDSGAQQASGTSQSGKEQSPAPTGRAADASAKDIADGLSTLDRVRFVQRVARAFEAIGARAGTVRLRLSPPELGTLRVEIAVRDGALSAHLQAENHVVRNLLLDNLPALRERLAQQDIRIDRFQVDVFDQSRTGNWQQPAGQSDWQQPGRYRTSLGERAAPAVGKTGRSPSSQRRLSLEGQLDVLI